MGHHKISRDPAVIDRDARAIQLRAQGLSYDDIAAAIGYANRGAAFKAVQRGLKAVIEPAVYELRQVEGERLNDVIKRFYEIATRDHVVTQHGRVVRDENGDTLPDYEPVMKALTGIVRASAAYRALMGLDLPVKVDVTATVATIEDTPLMALVRAAEQKNAEQEAALKSTVVRGEVEA